MLSRAIKRVSFRAVSAQRPSLMSTRGMASAVPLKMVKELRGLTGAPITDCKTALQEVCGNAFHFTFLLFLFLLSGSLCSTSVLLHPISHRVYWFIDFSVILQKHILISLT